jgi:hypothetical protein
MRHLHVHDMAHGMSKDSRCYVQRVLRIETMPYQR